MRIEFDSGAARARRWRVDLAERLAACGHEVAVARSAPARMAAETGLALLVGLERLLYGIAHPLCSESIDWPAGFAGSGAASDLVVDFGGKRLETPAEATTLIPLYDGRPGEEAAIGAVLDGHAPWLSIALRRPGDSEARLVAAALPALEEPLIFSLSIERVLRRMVSLLSRTIERFAAGRLDEQGPSLPVSPVPPRPGVWPASAFLVRGVSAKLARRLTSLCAHTHHWRIGWRWAKGDEVFTRRASPASPYAVLRDDARRFYADPFVLWRDGVAHVLCEEFPYATGKGVISAFSIRPDGAVSAPRVVLERPYHLSYPMVFARYGQIYMIPETSANRTVELYRATIFPDQWTLEATLLEGLSAADATLTERDGRLWLFAALAEDGGSSWDTLGLFHAERLTGPWSAHAANPVLIDAGSARPGGMLFEHGGSLIRPAQDCTAGYGSGLSLFRVDRLDPEGYLQVPLARLAPPPNCGAKGMHTLNAAGGLEVIDWLGLRPRRPAPNASGRP